ncbi:hypothetical protein AOG2_35000 [Geobacter sp. AOG2]|nr:hypothetical protein AOG2_35000 [Geobacter sp. AOG2]
MWTKGGDQAEENTCLQPMLDRKTGLVTDENPTILVLPRQAFLPPNSCCNHP